MCRAEMFAFSRGSVRLVLCVALCLQLLAAHAGEDPLPSWQEADATRAIVSFVRQAAERCWTLVRPFEKTDKPQIPSLPKETNNG